MFNDDDDIKKKKSEKMATTMTTKTAAPAPMHASHMNGKSFVSKNQVHWKKEDRINYFKALAFSIEWNL